MELGFEFVTGPAAAYLQRIVGIAREWVSALNHEPVDDSMEERAVVKTLGYKRPKVIAVPRCLIGEPNSHRAVIGRNLKYGWLGLPIDREMRGRGAGDEHDEGE